ncbi:MAG: M13 family metallopeptidase [Pseudomonadales bacterium]|nr:M13 family metallopeptidase [Pseudomonadales bacterium]MCP5184713.1 M13 family metallopeptidase [Pseudomonadales bacterium]
MRLILLFLVALLCAACMPGRIPGNTAGEGSTNAPDPAADIGPDPTIRPADDLYAHVNARWLAVTPIPDDQVRYGTVQQVVERTETQVLAILASTVSNPSPDPEVTRVADLYRAFLDTDSIEARGLRPLDDLLDLISRLDSHQAVWHAFATLMPMGVEAPLGLFTETDADDPDRVIAYFWQSGLGLPDRDYYLGETEKFISIRDAYRAHMRRLTELAGWTGFDVDAVLSLERDLAGAQWSRVQNRDRATTYRNHFTLDTAVAHTGGLDWPGFLHRLGVPDTPHFVLAQASYFADLGGIIERHPVATWRHYLRWRTLKAYAPYLTSAIDTENFAFEGTVLRGQAAQRSRDKRAVTLITAIAGEALGQLYVARHFPETHRERIGNLVQALLAAYRDGITRSPWMQEQTRAAALAKLDALTLKLGYPDTWRDYTGLVTNPADLAGNVRRGQQFRHAWMVGRIGKRPDRGEWGMAPHIVNAYYRPTYNEIVFPAAILQPPMFDPDADDAVNFGGIGAVIGHEISHGFDDQGRKFDATGRLHDWWQAEDALDYQTRADRLAAQYDQYHPLPDTPINGTLTLGENIADLAGLTMALNAWRRLHGGKDTEGERRLFVAYARTWRTKLRDGYLHEMLLTDPHSPPEFRVTGVVRNLGAFHEAFGVQPGDGMYLAEDQRVHIW